MGHFGAQAELVPAAHAAREPAIIAVHLHFDLGGARLPGETLLD